MALNLKGRSFLSLMDFSPEEIRYLLDLSHALKAKKKMGVRAPLLSGKNIVLLFEKTSTRTRCAFEVAAKEEGAGVTFLEQKSSQMGKKESVRDTANVLGRMFDAIEYRGYEQSLVEDLARYSGVPVFNGLTDYDHPTQILADMLTIEEHLDKPLSKVKIVFAGDLRNNMCYAWLYGAAKMGMHFVGFGPKSLSDELDKNILAKLDDICKTTGGKFEFSEDMSCVKGADVIYTDIWASMGEEDLVEERTKLLSPYKVTTELIGKTENKDVIFMHCLPAFHDFETEFAKECKERGFDIREVDDEVFYGKHSVVFDEAENRMHTIKAVMVAMI